MISEDYAKNKAVKLLMLAHSQYLALSTLAQQMTDAKTRVDLYADAREALERYCAMRELATATSLLSWDEAHMNFELIEKSA